MWQREWVSFCKHYGCGEDAVLNYLSRYVFRTAISNARILSMDRTYVTFRWNDRTGGGWRIERVPGVEFLGRFLQHVLPKGFHRFRYYGLWHPSKRSLSARARNLLMLEVPTDASNSATLADILDALGQPPGSSADDVAGDEPSECPRCPRCGEPE